MDAPAAADRVDGQRPAGPDLDEVAGVAEALVVLREVRALILPLLPDVGDRASRWAAALDTAEAAALVREGRGDDLRERLIRRLLADAMHAPDRQGIVYLVGAGPGDPKLITVRGAEVLGLADVVVYDRLASPALLDLVLSTVERIYAGKEPGRSAIPQPEIDSLLVSRALGGKRVVRLKGGDPFVFGRGGEEMLACARAGVQCEVVPGITSAIAAPALAGIPVTHRGVAQSFAVVTGSTAHTILGTLADLPALASAAQIGPPATLVVGAVVALLPATAQEEAPAARAVRT
ncbi:MAG: uroporphyrinogen-III C-methyltransferase [Actinomycetota bacterium]